MKFKDLVRHLRECGCEVVREGRKHAVYTNLTNGMMTTVPRHSNIHPFLAKKICKDLGIPVSRKIF